MTFNILKPEDKDAASDQEAVVDFLFKHLEQYGDPREDIRKAVDYALQISSSPGGCVVAGFDEGRMVGAVVMNKTGMKGYIPENILVYIAVDGSRRGKGYGRRLMQKAIESVDGAIALHVEPDNPAKFLYEKLGFTNKYLEMRLTR